MIGYFNTYIAKYYDTPKKKSYTFLGLSLGLVIIFVVFAIRPTFSTVVELRQKLREGQEANKALNEKITSLTSAQENYAKVVDSLPLLNAALPTEKKIVDFLNKVNLLAGSNELVVEALEHKIGREKEEATGENTLEFTVSGRGSYEKIKNFVGKLENLPRLVNIKNAEVTRKEGEEKLGFTVVGRVYYEITE